MPRVPGVHRVRFMKGNCRPSVSRDLCEIGPASCETLPIRRVCWSGLRGLGLSGIGGTSAGLSRAAGSAAKIALGRFATRPGLGNGVCPPDVVQERPVDPCGFSRSVDARRCSGPSVFGRSPGESSEIGRSGTGRRCCAPTATLDHGHAILREGVMLLPAPRPARTDRPDIREDRVAALVTAEQGPVSGDAGARAAERCPAPAQRRALGTHLSAPFAANDRTGSRPKRSARRVRQAPPPSAETSRKYAERMRRMRSLLRLRSRRSTTSFLGCVATRWRISNSAPRR